MIDETEEPQAAASDTHSPADWAKSTFPPNPSGRMPFDYWKHVAADVMHGWTRHAYHEGAPMQLSAADYLAALEAVSKGPEPHPAALSKHRKRPKPPAGEGNELELSPDHGEKIFVDEER